MIPSTRFRTALRKLNPSLPPKALQEAELAVTANRSAMLPVAANRDVYRLLREGVPGLADVEQRPWARLRHKGE